MMSIGGAIQKMANYFGLQKSDIIEPSDTAAILSLNSRAVKKGASLNQYESKLLDDYQRIKERIFYGTHSFAVLNRIPHSKKVSK